MKDSKKHVLVVDPDTLLAGSIRDYLLHHNYSVRIAHTADDALRLSDIRRPDYIVLELALGAHSGIEFLHEFRSYSDWKNVPVIVLSIVRVSKPKALRKLGVESYLYKPESSLRQLKDCMASMPA